MWRKRRQVAADERVVEDVERTRERTMNRAVRLLAAKPRSVGELRERLLEKRWTNEQVVGSVIEKLKEYGYLDDEQYARDLAVSKLRQKPQGRHRLMQALSQKPLEKQTVSKAVAEAFESHTEEEMIDAAIVRRIASHGEPKTLNDRQKLYAYLLRRGFPYDLIHARIRLINVAKSSDH